MQKKGLRREQLAIASSSALEYPKSVVYPQPMLQVPSANGRSLQRRDETRATHEALVLLPLLQRALALVDKNKAKVLFNRPKAHGAKLTLEPNVIVKLGSIPR